MPVPRTPDSSAFLAQMGLGKSGVRKGSVVIPLLALLLAVLGFFVFRTGDGRDGHEFMNKLFETSCRGVRGSSVASDWTNKKTTPLRDECRKLGTADADREAAARGLAALEGQFRAMKASTKFEELNAFHSSETMRDGKQPGIANLVQFMANAYVQDLFADFRDIVTSTLQTLWYLALYSFAPGIAGLVYRRNFWAWFLIPFGGLLALTTFGVLPLPSIETMPESGKILGFVTVQMLILLLAYRLRRYSNSARALWSGVVPARIYNYAVLAVLAVVGAACFLGQPAAVWKALLLDQTLLKYEFLLLGLPLLYSLLRRSELVSSLDRKNIVVCLDGTSNTPDQWEMGYLAQTNVFKLFSMLKPDDPKGVVAHGTFDASITKKYGERQFGFYYTGVGNKFETSPIGQILGQATGMGASDIVQRAYLDVMRIYQPGDRIFIFGFSRGAAIARLLARAIDQRGAPSSVWTLRLLGRHWLVWKSRHKRPEDARVPIAVLGCWDTVGAFGLAKKFAGIDFQRIDLFKDMSVPDNVQQAYHLVALDEQRDSFVPTLMEPDPIRPERIVEVWFSGDHANVGGGWATPKLSDVTLDFMLRHVSSGYAHSAGMEPGNEDWGILLSSVNSREQKLASDGARHPVALDPDPLGQVRQWASKLYEYEARPLPLHAVISETVFERMTKSHPVYAPQALFNHNEALEKKRATVAREIQRLSRTSSLTPEERKAILEFKDKLRLMRWPQYVEGLEAERKSSGRTVDPPSTMLTNNWSDF